MKQVAFFFAACLITAPIYAQEPATITCAPRPRIKMIPIYSDARAPWSVGTVYCDEPITFLTVEYGYAKIRIGKDIGYVDAQFVRPLEAAPKMEEHNVNLKPDVTTIKPSPAAAERGHAQPLVTQSTHDSAQARPVKALGQTKALPLQVSEPIHGISAGVQSRESAGVHSQGSDEQDLIANTKDNSVRPREVSYIRGKQYWVSENGKQEVMLGVDEEGKYLVLTISITNRSATSVTFLPERITVKDLVAGKDLAYFSPEKVAAAERSRGSWRKYVAAVGAGMQAYGASAPRVSTSYSSGNVQMNNLQGGFATGSFSGRTTTYSTPSQAEIARSQREILAATRQQQQERQQADEARALAAEQTAAYSQTIQPGASLVGKVHFAKAKVGDLEKLLGESGRGYAIRVSVPIDTSVFEFDFPVKPLK